jgi:protein associated with RNAse G/E
VLQEVWREKLWAVRPLTVVEDSNDRLILWCPRGTIRKVPGTPPERPRPPSRTEHVVRALSRCDWVLENHEWDVSTLWLLEPRASHAVWVSFLPDGRHLGWYVNLQEPYRRTSRGIQAMDMMLDIVVAPDRSWRWKDEDEFQAVIDAGLYTPTAALAVRAEAASVVRRIENRLAPFDEPWPEWRPSSQWSIPRLLNGWDQLD